MENIFLNKSRITYNADCEAMYGGRSALLFMCKAEQSDFLEDYHVSSPVK